MRYAIRAEAGKPLELDILDVIADSWFGVSARTVVERLRGTQADTIKVRINSRGGEVLEGFAIYELLKQHKASVEVQVLGLAGSIASVIAMAGDKISIGEGGFIMIHNPSGVMRGESQEFRRFADLLDNMQSVIADVYVARTGQKKEDVLQWMNAETYMGAKQALERGFVDAIIPAKTKGRKPKATASAFAIFNEAELDGAPEELLAAVRAAHAAASEPESAPARPALPQPQDPPAPDRGGAESENQVMKNAIKLLALSDDADEAAVVAAIKRLQTRAEVGAELEQLLGVTGREVLGAVRALKTSAEANAELGSRVAQLQIVNARREFEAARDQGLKEKRLTPAVAKHYTDKFEAALRNPELDADGQARQAEAVAEDLKGFLKVAPRIVAAAVPQPAGTSGNADPVPQHNGKAFEDMKPIERAVLKRDNPDLYNTLREDAVARGAI